MKIISIVLFALLLGCGSSQQPRVEQRSGAAPSNEPAAQNSEASRTPSNGAEASDPEAPDEEIELFSEGGFEEVEVEATEDNETPSLKKKGRECDDHNDCVTLCVLGCGTGSCVEGYCKFD